MRAVRELFMNHSLRAGRLVLHSASLSVSERVVLIAGTKAAGKTSLLTHLLRSPSARYVGNDRALVTIDDSPTALGMPSVVSVREPMLDLFPELRERFLAARAAVSVALFGVREWRKRSELFLVPNEPPAPAEEKIFTLSHRWVERVPSFECRLGLEAFLDPSSANDLLTAVFGAST
jgi:hypothetical protein